MSVRYLVKAPAFVNGSRVSPRADGEPVHVMGPAGLHGAALEQVDPPLGKDQSSAVADGTLEDALNRIKQLEGGLQVASDAFKALDTYLREVYPDLPEHYGMPVDGVRLTIEHLQAKTVPGQDDGKGSEQLVEIPADWESQHHRTIIALAQKILPGEQKDMTKDDAITVIKAEIEKRAAQKE